jgi:hypothetical protein
MFQVQRASPGATAAWKTICANASEAYARKVYDRQLKLNSVGRYRLLDPQGKVLAEASAQGLFQTQDADEEQRQPTYFVPTPPSLKSS